MSKIKKNEWEMRPTSWRKLQKELKAQRAAPVTDIDLTPEQASMRSTLEGIQSVMSETIADSHRIFQELDSLRQAIRGDAIRDSFRYQPVLNVNPVSLPTDASILWGIEPRYPSLEAVAQGQPVPVEYNFSFSTSPRRGTR